MKTLNTEVTEFSEDHPAMLSCGSGLCSQQALEQLHMLQHLGGVTGGRGLVKIHIQIQEGCCKANFVLSWDLAL